MVVRLALLPTERRVQNVLLLRGQVRLDVRLEAAKEEGLEERVEVVDDLTGALGTEGLLDVGDVEPFLEGLEVLEDVGENEVEERPELGEVVLRWLISCCLIRWVDVRLHATECQSKSFDARCYTA